MNLEHIELRKLIWTLTKPQIFIKNNVITIVCYDKEDADLVYKEIHETNFKKRKGV